MVSNMYLWAFLAVGMVVALVVVIVGLARSCAVKVGNKRASNKLMVIRVGAQALSILVLFVIWVMHKG